MNLLSQFQLPVFDASKTGLRIMDSVVRPWRKARRQKPAVGNEVAAGNRQASGTGSLVGIAVLFAKIAIWAQPVYGACRGFWIFCSEKRRPVAQ